MASIGSYRAEPDSTRNNRHSENYTRSKRRITHAELYENWSQLYAQIEGNSDAFDIWEELIEASEALEGGICKASSDRAIQLLRFTYDTFLKRFPQMHMYWIKWAKWEFKLGQTEEAERIFRQAVGNIPCSVPLWKEYCGFKFLIEPDVNRTRQLFETAVEQVGLHFLSHSVWDLYIQFEEREQDEYRLFRLYERIVKIPLHQYARYFSKLMALCEKVPLEIQVPPAYLEQFRAEYEVEKSEQENIGNHSTTDELLQEEQSDLRSRILTFYHQIYVSTQNHVAARWQYESTIKRSFFHVVYLFEEEMVNWRRYLHFEEVEGDEDRIITLYERAVIPTARYEEFWIRYALWLTSSHYIEQARLVFQRGAYAVPMGRTQLRLMYAQFEEAHGDLEAAKDIYSSILQVMPANTETIIALANLKRRHESVVSAVEFLQTKYKSLLETSGFEGDAAIIIATLAEMTLNFNGGITAARKIYESTAYHFLASYKFWHEYLKFEINQFNFAKSKEEQKEIIRSVYTQITTISQLAPNEMKDLGHIYQVHLLSSGNLDSQLATLEYFKVDGDIHKQY